MDADDFFDFLPDPVLLLILNKLADLKDLGRCSLLSRRFYELAFKVDNVTVKFESDILSDDKRKRLKSHLRKSLFESLLKPFRALNLFRKKKTAARKVSDHLIREGLRNFKQMRHLQIELPAGELAFGNDVLLKWRAEFGSAVENCVILGASSLVKDERPQEVHLSKSRFRMIQKRMADTRHSVLSEEADNRSPPDENISWQENTYTDMEMRLSVFWTISSLVAATARHYLFQKTISDHPFLESLMIGDATGQGTLCMSKDQLQKYRESLSTGSASFARRHVPSLSVRLWHAPYLQLSEGMALRGATLVAIEPNERAPHNDEDDFIAGAFEEPFNSATSRLIKRRTYLLEMQSL